MRNYLAAAIVIFFFAGCASAPSHEQAGLAGTSWRLLAFQSMDDSQGVTRVNDSDQYTIDFQAEGRAVLSLDCNRGTASWSATASADHQSGTIQFGPLAITRAYCPPPSLADRLARDLGFVRGYLIKDGRLYLSLMADAGIYEWIPR